MKQKKFWLKQIFITISFFTPVLLYAQGPGFEDDVVDTPVDGGASVIIAVAAWYGAKKMKAEVSKRT